MRKILLLAAAMMTATAAYAQRDTTVNMNEVEVTTARVITRSDGMLIIPTDRQRESSPDGYSLLEKMRMPMLRVDETSHAVSAIDNKGVQIRVNGAIATKAELMSLDARLVRNIEYINNPGVRYGDGIGYVVNIRTRRTDMGYSIGTSLSNAVTKWQGDDMAFARWNHRNSELSLSYDFGYSDTHGRLYHESADYLLNSGAHYYISRADSARRARSFTNEVQLKYNLADSASYVFQATLTGDFSHNPGSWLNRRFTETGTDGVMTLQRDRDKSFSPVLDLYFYHTLGSHQSLTANVVGTSIATDQYNYNDEGSVYAYAVDGNTWSLTSEAIYENRLKPFTVSAGVNHQLKYTRNRYSGDASATNNMHNSTLYLFSQLKGSLPAGGYHTLGYTLGLGVSNARYSQGSAGYDRWFFRPKATVSYNISKPISVSYSFEVSQHISQIAMISDTRIRTNSLEWTVGNPDIKPNSTMTHDVRLSYSKQRLYSQVLFEWRRNHNVNMASYERTSDDQFLYIQKNQPHVNMLYIMDYTSYDIIPDRLTATFNGGMFRYFNRGDDYNHCLTTWLYGGTVQAYLGKWSLLAYADSGFKFMEGESWSHQEAMTELKCSYRIGKCQLSLTWLHPFESNPRTLHGGLVNQYIHKDMGVRSTASGNAVFVGFSWRINNGRHYKDINRTLENSDKQTGIL